MNIRIKRLNKSLPLPAYATAGSAGLDLCASIDTAVWLQPGERRLIPSGIAVEIPLGYEGQVRARSGLAVKHGFGMVNGVGTIDCDYRGEVGLLLINLGDAPVKIEPGMRCAQLVIAACEQPKLVEVEELGETGRGVGGFGSSGQ